MRGVPKELGQYVCVRKDSIRPPFRFLILALLEYPLRLPSVNPTATKEWHDLSDLFSSRQAATTRSPRFMTGILIDFTPFGAAARPE